MLTGRRVLESPLAYENPIDELYAQQLHFMLTGFEGAAELAEP